MLKKGVLRHITQLSMNVNSKTLLLNSVDITSEIASYIHAHALLPLLLSCKTFNEGVRRNFKYHNTSLKSDAIYFVTSMTLSKWALSMGCKIRLLCRHAAGYGQLNILMWLINHFNNSYLLERSKIIM